MRVALKIAATSFALTALASAAEVAATKERTYVVKYTDQSIERYAVQWKLDVDAKVREEGGSYVPYQGAAENRRCTWSVSSGIERSVSLATRLGQAMPLAGMARKLGGAEPLNGGHAGACGGAEPERDAAIARARKSALESFERITDADLDELRKSARANAQVSDVTVQ
jgi:hypothetical protein